jgi:Dioxygenase
LLDKGGELFAFILNEISIALEKLNRSDLTTNTTDTYVLNTTPLTLTMTIMEYASSGCSALVGAQVDIWHADAAGIYSDESVENTTGQTFLRGYQITDSNGAVTFKTVVPRLVQRTNHPHSRDASNPVLFRFRTYRIYDATVFRSDAPECFHSHRFSVQFAGSAGYHERARPHL